ncbi:MAG: response regulator [Hyphomicrobiaceae bacterium]|nr:response regulator [Hyphomicrobiaceae bacterium]
MRTTKSGSGGEILAQRNETTQAKRGLPALSDVLIVEDENFDANRLQATLHLVLGRETNVRRAASLGAAIDSVIQMLPDMVFLDDYLKPSDTATDTIPFLRRAGYNGPIIVISGEVDRARRVELRSAGASDAIHKDDLDSAKVAEALIRAFGKSSAANQSKTAATGTGAGTKAG